MGDLALRAAFPRTVIWPSGRGLSLPLFVGAAYYAGCLAGFELRFPASGISFFWPPTAVLTAALALTPRRSWWALLTSSFVAHAIAHTQDGVPIAAWPIQFLGNATQAALAAEILHRYSRPTALFGSLREVLVFVAGASVLAPAAASLLPAYVYVRQGWAPDFSDAWTARTISNVVASLTLIPCVLVSWQYVSAKPGRIPRRLLEYALLLLCLIAVVTAVAIGARPDLLGLSIALYAPLPCLLWATIRFGGPGLSFALLWTGLATISMVSAGHGPLAAGTATNAVLGVQVFIVATAIPMLLIAGLVEDNRAEHATVIDIERQNRAILDAHPDLMFLQTRDGVFLQYYAKNPAHLLTRPDLFVGRNMRDVLPGEVAGRFADLFQTVSADTPGTLEYSLDVDGASRRYEARVIRVGDDRMLSVVRDITDRWRAENALREGQERFALATTAGGIGVWDLDIPTGIVKVQGSSNTMLGYDDNEVGSTLPDWERLIDPTDLHDVRSRIRSFMGAGSPRFDLQFRMRHKTGAVRWIALTGAVTRYLDGAPVRMTGTCMDITERTESARALKEANDALVRLGRIAALSELSASIAHELNQPLTAIKANANACRRWLASGTESSQVLDALADVVEDSERAAHIVQRTHALFSNQPVRKRSVNLNALIGNMLEMTGGLLREHAVRVEVQLEKDLPEVLADAVQIQQVLLNLIVNGVDAMLYTDREPRVLRISSRRCRHAVVISVRDTGKGFEPMNVRRLFDPFYTTKAGGLGMGLTISQSIIRTHHGALWAIANVAGGATFRFRIPIVVPSPRQLADAPASRRILVVDDHEGMRNAIGRLLRTWGHTVAVASDGSTGLMLAESFRPDVVILDVSLEGMTGIEVARGLRGTASLPNEPRLIALTASTDADLRQACLDAGFDAYLVKPEGVSELERLL
jgi:PAS domain S-box-containing protein